jgi:hypothetical protein
MPAPTTPDPLPEKTASETPAPPPSHKYRSRKIQPPSHQARKQNLPGRVDALLSASGKFISSLHSN